jgi:predicted Fe-Mo cluster-binding NifX family protein
MRIAIPVCGRDTATTLDFACELLIVEVESTREMMRTRVQFDSANDSVRLRQLLDEHVDVLICGAISRSLAAALKDSGIQIFPLVSGPVEDILTAFTTDQLTEPKYLMAGCTAEDRARLVRHPVSSVR